MKRLAVSLCVACGTNAQPTGSQPSPSANGITVLESEPADALVLDVRAFRWACSVMHPRGVEELDLRVPVGRAIKLHVWTLEPTSGMEVAIVGTPLAKPVVADKPVDLVFRIDRAGMYEWRCPTITPPEIEPPPDEPSATKLAPEALNPIKKFQAISVAEYEAFLEVNDPTTPESVIAFGKQLYEKKGCVACHTIDGTPRIGPSWKGIWGTSVTGRDGKTRVVDEDFVRESVLTPGAFVLQGYITGAMPSFEGQLKPRELAALIAFIQSLK